MATYWVDPVGGSNGNPGGPLFSQAKQTVAAGLALLTVKGDILNLVNTGSHPISATTNLAATLTGTSFSDPGATIRGTDSAGLPALTTIRWSSSQSAIGVRTGANYIIIQGIKCDRTLSSSNFAVQRLAVMNDVGAGPLRIQYCWDECSTTRNGGMVSDATSSASTTQLLEVRYCVFKNCSGQSAVNISGTSHRPLSVHHNVYIYDQSVAAQALVNMGVDDASAAVNHEFINNTILMNVGRLAGISSAAASANAAALKKIHSNVFADVSATAGTDIFTTGNAAFLTYTGVLTAGYTVFFNPAGTFHWAASQPWKVPFDPDSSDTAPSNPDTGTYWPTDVSTTSDPFNARTTPWDWANINGSGYTLTLPGDLRLIANRTAGLGGTVPGAIIEGVGVPSDPPIFYPGSSGLPVGVNAPAFLFDGPDGVNAAVRIRRNTELGALQLFDGVIETITHVMDARAVLSTNVANSPIPILASSRLFMLEADGDVTIKLNNSNQMLLRAGSCMLIDGATINTFTATNASTVRRVTLKYFGAR